MTQLQTQVKIDTWISATWDEYLRFLEQPNFEKAKGYYYHQQMRIEMSPVGNPHAKDHAIIIYAIHLFASLKEIDLNGLDNCTYRKTGYQEAQPDASFYIGETVDAIPWETKIIDLDSYPPPSLVVEVAASSLGDDLGQKRLLYEELGVQEYWIIDVEKTQVFAFAIANTGSYRINQSQVLPNLEIALLENALKQTRTTNHSRVGAWLLNQFQI